MKEDELENCIIEKFFKMHDYYQIFTDKFIMNIENPFTIEYLGKIIEYDDVKSFLEKEEKLFFGSKIIKCTIKENIEFILRLSNKITIKIFLDDEHTISPEPVFISFLKDNKMVVIGWREL